MKTENTISDHSRHGEVIEGVCEVLPNIGISIFPQAFVIKPITIANMGDSKKIRGASSDKYSDDEYGEKLQ